MASKFKYSRRKSWEIQIVEKFNQNIDFSDAKVEKNFSCFGAKNSKLLKKIFDSFLASKFKYFRTNSLEIYRKIKSKLWQIKMHILAPKFKLFASKTSGSIFLPPKKVEIKRNSCSEAYQIGLMVCYHAHWFWPWGHDSALRFSRLFFGSNSGSRTRKKF